MKKHLGSIATGLIFAGLVLPLVPWEHFRPAGPTLHDAAARGDAADATRLLDRGSDVDARDVEGQTPLHRASRSGSAPLVDLLIRRGAAVGARDSTLRTPLHVAGSAEVARRLIAAGADVRAQAQRFDGFTPLHTAVEAGDLALVQVLLDNGASINESNAVGYTALAAAARAGSLPAARYLLRKGADINGRAPGTWTPLMIAASGDAPDTALFLTARGADVRLADQWGVTALHCVTEPQVAGQLIARGADVHAVTQEGRTPLHIVARGIPKKSAAVMRLLIGRRAEIDRPSADNGETPLHVAATAAARFGDTCAVELLLKKGAAVDLRDHKGRTPLATVLLRDPGRRVGRRRDVYLARRDAVVRLLRRHGAAG